MIHIFNGDAVATQARRVGIPGEHLPFREALVEGPAPRDLEIRAEYLSSISGENLLRTRNSLLDQQRALQAAREHDEIVLWFEHDLFCLANLLSLLDRFHDVRRLTLVWTAEPLSQLELTPLLAQRAPAMRETRELARDAWSAWCDSDPSRLNAFIGVQRRELPFLGEGFALHGSRFPSIRNGLGAVEQRILAAVSGGAATFAAIFAAFDVDPPRFGLGDSNVLRTARALAARRVPLLTVAGGPAVADMRFVITTEGEGVMHGEADDVLLNGRDEWLGGVHLTSGDFWRWDDQQRRIVEKS